MKISSSVGAKRQHLHSCSLVRGKKFYGYHPNEQLFIKIVLYYPQEVSRVSTLLLSGGLMNHKFQPHEAHFPYLLQILIDHNLCGMGHLHLSSLKFRNPLPEIPSDLISSIKRVKMDFTYREAIPPVETSAVDPAEDYSSLKEGLEKEKALSIFPQPMKEDTLSTLPAFRSSSLAVNPATIKVDSLGTLPGSNPSSPVIYLRSVKEETSSAPPGSKSSSPAVWQVKDEAFSVLPHVKLSSPIINHMMTKDDILSPLHGSKSSPPTAHLTTLAVGSQLEIWVQNSIPRDWIWPLIASDNMHTEIQGQGLYSKQSTCELEADACVEDILNRSELLFLPLQQAGPEIKMVQSLTPMWEEERARSGESGPAGSVDPLYQPTARTSPIPSPFEQAMRETLYQIAQAEEAEIGAKNDSRSGSPQSDLGSGTQSFVEISTLLGSQQELKVSLGSADSDALHSDEDEPDERQRSSVPLEPESKARPSESTQTGLELTSIFSPHGEGPSTARAHVGKSFGSSRRNQLKSSSMDAAKDGGSYAINEEIIKKQLSQRCTSQDLDKEVAEFLRWMGSSQLDFNDQEDGHPDDKDGQIAQMGLSQMFSSPGMDEALLKALAEYENATEEECQAILDCANMMDEEDQDLADYQENLFTHVRAQEEGDKSEKAFTAPLNRNRPSDSIRESGREGAPPFIPQTDGAGDEDDIADEGDQHLQSVFSKRPRFDKQDASVSRQKHTRLTRGNQSLSKEQNTEVSLRDMMRKRRERKPGRKELWSPSSSILEDVSSEVGPLDSSDSTRKRPSIVQKRPRDTVLQDQSMLVSLMEDSPQSNSILESTSRGTSVNKYSTAKRIGKVISKSDYANQLLTSRYGTLPIVTLKYDSADVNCPSKELLEKDSEACRNSSREHQGTSEHKSSLQLLPEGSSQTSLRHYFVATEVAGDENTGMQSRGDDRDCGGGSRYFCLDQASHKEDSSDSLLNAHGCDTLQVRESHEADVQLRKVESFPEVESPEEDDYFVAQTQFLNIAVPQSPQISELHTGHHVDDVNVSSQDAEALMLSQTPMLAFPVLTSQNRRKYLENRDGMRVRDEAYVDPDLVKKAQVVKPDVSCMVEVRPVEFESRDNLELEVRESDGLHVEQTQILSPFIPFLDSREPRIPDDHIVDNDGFGIGDEDEELAGQTQILELENTHGASRRTLTEIVECDVADMEDEAVNQTQVVNPEIPLNNSAHRCEPGVFLEEGRDCDIVDEDAEFGTPTHVLEGCSPQDPDSGPKESYKYAEEMDDEYGPDDEFHRQSQKLKLDISSAAEIHLLDTGDDLEQMKGGDRLQEGSETRSKTQLLIPKKVLPSVPFCRTTLEVSTSGSPGDFLKPEIPKVMGVEMISSLQSGLPAKILRNPQETDIPSFFPGGKSDCLVRDAEIPAGGVKSLEGRNCDQTIPTQYLFCDISDDSEASYDSEQERWSNDGGASTTAFFDQKEIAELGSPSCADDHVKERWLTTGREIGSSGAAALEDNQDLITGKAARTASEETPRRMIDPNRLDQATGHAYVTVSPSRSEADEKGQGVEGIRGRFTVEGDAEEYVGPNTVGMHSTQYLFTDMSDDSDASYDSGRDGRERDSSWNAAEEFFADEEKDVGTSLLVAEEGLFSGSHTERESGLTAFDHEEDRRMAEASHHGTAVHVPFSVNVIVGKERQNSDLVLLENFHSKPGTEVSHPICSSTKYSNSLEIGVLKTSLLTSGGLEPQTTSPLRASGLSSVSPHFFSGTSSGSTTCGVCYGPEEDVKSLAVSGLKLVEEEDRPVMMNEKDRHLSTESCLHASMNRGIMGAIMDTKHVQLDVQSHPEAPEYTDWKSALALVPFPKNLDEQQLIPLIFHQRPPTKEQVLETSKEFFCHHKEDDVFYGNIKDVSDHPVVRAGLVFDVRSREAVHLRRFQFGRSSRRSNFDEGSKNRVYIQQEGWGREDFSGPIAGIPKYIENDGTLFYLITLAKAPPSPRSVKQWLSLQSVQRLDISKGIVAGGQQLFTMDSNTGKLVPLVEIGSAANSQESVPKTECSEEDGEFVRPASPKYDERHVFYLTHSSSMLPSSHGFSQRRPNALKYGDHSGTSSLHNPSEEGKDKFDRLPPLAPCTAQTSEQKSLAMAERTTREDLSLKKSSVAKPVDSGVRALLNRKLNIDVTTRARGKHWRDISQMTAFSPAAETPLSQSGFRDPASSGLGQQITLMSVEAFAETRGELLPDPRYDAIGCIVLVLHEDCGRTGSTTTTVALVRDEEAYSTRRYPDGIQGCEMIYLPNEKTLFKCFAHLVRLCDPDMLIGWEVQGFSLGLLAERAANLGISLLKQLSRIPPKSTAASELLDKEVGTEDQAEAAFFDRVPVETVGADEPIIDDEWGRTHGSGLYIGGRTVLNAWRIMRGEVKLNIYSIEAVAEAVLRRRVPRLPWQTLTRCFTRGPSGGRHHCIQYFIDRARLTLEIMEQLDLMNRTAELARVFGIDFYSVFSRGSQFRVESMMARLAHTQNYLLVSPTRQQVADQPGMQCLPLVMEPESRFYNSPVIVLDFQSLYPSMIIAYNLCFSTCLGKLSADNPKVLGVTKLKLDPGSLSSLKEAMTITPNGVMFAPKEVLPGVLPRLLQEILSTRIMVKKAMKKLAPDERVLERVMNARQFALKLIANVTYGYTAAGFSGRMPCAEIADSIVQCGRLTLERAINMVNTHPRWNARVVYGDTDSMFVLCEGRTKDEAFKIGQEIVASVTETNPPPVTLKLEKVYLPCVLLTKKRYVGYSYESASQVKPIFDAKGIETIRRDTCPAVAKAVEHSLRILFESQDLSQVKQYLQRQWGKILSGRVSIQDFVFAKEVRLGTYSARSPVLPPAAIVASKAMAVDPRAEPRYAERIPYVVVHGEPGARLVDMVVDPLTLITQPSLRLHDTYYITKQIIPACQRIFMLVGVDLRAWFSEMPRVYRPPTSKRVANLAMGARSTRWDPDARKLRKMGHGLRHGTIDQYFLSRHCTICGEFTRASQLLCSVCFANPRAAAILLPGRTARLEKEYKHLQAICRHCGGGDGGPEGNIACISLDCSVFFELRKVHRELTAAGAVSNDLGYYPPCLPELF
ncbi:DNA polymerase zeta [Marchantia polymorpha subsp. ruderalis]|nr:hypothetical protein MARPO_0082s0049 [Marchantia polymorpha]BBN02455.1 hypothetical protein Mp_2g15520 [Marchantia polymorpha subsp. ruderalis]|eukprot:PTQ34202.1 hypothetical protein MARPO_0082s0049 [Marchantia polymorpha]